MFRMKLAPGRSSPIQPLRGGRVGASAVGLIDEFSPQVREGFADRTRLAVIDQVGLILGYAVGQLVSDHVVRGREPVAVDHLSETIVPESSS